MDLAAVTKSTSRFSFSINFRVVGNQVRRLRIPVPVFDVTGPEGVEWTLLRAGEAIPYATAFDTQLFRLFSGM